MSQAPTSNDCGDCTVCCHSLRVIELDKPAGIYCQHCVPGKGCGIYETRFDICRTFLCGWRQVPQLGDAWRPVVRTPVSSIGTSPLARAPDQTRSRLSNRKSRADRTSASACDTRT